MEPPDYLSEDLMNLLLPAAPRIAVVTQRHLMERYRSLEDGELRMRYTVAGEHWSGCNLWLGLDLPPFFGPRIMRVRPSFDLLVRVSW